MARRATFESKWDKVIDLPPEASGPGEPRSPHPSPDGLTIVFHAAGSDGAQNDLWMTQRKSLTEPFGPAINVGPPVNTRAPEAQGYLLGDNQTLVFHRGGEWFVSYFGPTGTKSAVKLSDNPFTKTDGIWFAPDGRAAYFSADRPGGLGGKDLWVSHLVPKK
jgi:hypothetical protein